MDTSYLSTQVTSIIGQLHALFDEIGVPNHDRSSRESELFTALSETLNNHLRQVTAEKNELTSEANRIIKTIKQMQVSLEDRQQQNPHRLDEENFQVTIPLNQCLQRLKEKHNTIAKVHRDRFEQVKKLVQALESYSSHLEPSFVRIKLPPTSDNVPIPTNFDLSPAYVTSLDQEFTRVYEEYGRRVSTVQTLSEDVVNLWAELGTPQAQTDSTIVKHYRDAPEQLGLHDQDIKHLQSRRDRLQEEKRGRERKIKELKTIIEGLWDRLGVEQSDQKRFLAGNRGCGLRAINEFEAELDRLNELKRQNLHVFVEDTRCRLQELWDDLYFSEEEMLQFAPAFSDVYSDALLSAHEAEIARLEAIAEQRAPTLEMVKKHRSLVKDRDDLASAAQDGSRLLAKNNKGEKRDPTRLLREEKMRKRIAKELPKVEVELKKVLEHWEDEYGRPFLVHGEPYLDELAAAAAKPVPPPRSKTPNGLSTSTTTKKVPLKSEATATGPRAGGIMRSAAPSRAGTATPAGTIRRNPVAASSTKGGTTPSKIPSRVPLSHMQHGGNSPERKAQQSTLSKATANTTYDTSTIRKMGPPARAPPPKMRDLFNPPESSSVDQYNDENLRCASVASSSGTGSVRQITPEDVYDDRERMSYVTTSMMQQSSERNTPQNYRDVQRFEAASQQQYMPPPPAPPESRQMSATSSVTGTSGSENWETFDDASEYGTDDHGQGFQHQRVRNGMYNGIAVSAGMATKRVTPDGGHTPPRIGGGPTGKKFKAIYGVGGHSQSVTEENGGRRVATGSDSAWTDEDAF